MANRDRLHKCIREWLTVFLFASIACTWIFFAVMQTAIEKKDISVNWGFVVTCPFLAALWISTYEVPLFSGIELREDYLVLKKSSLVPYYRYIRIDTVKRVSQSKSRLESLDRHNPTSFLPVSLYQLSIFTHDGKQYKSTRIPIDQAEKKRFVSNMWARQSVKKFMTSSRRETYWRVACIPLMMRCLVLLLIVYIFVP